MWALRAMQINLLCQVENRDNRVSIQRDRNKYLKKLNLVRQAMITTTTIESREIVGKHENQGQKQEKP